MSPRRAERARRWEQLADLYLVGQLSCYPPDYLAAKPTPERLLETVERTGGEPQRRDRRERERDRDTGDEPHPSGAPAPPQAHSLSVAIAALR